MGKAPQNHDRGVPVTGPRPRVDSGTPSELDFCPFGNRAQDQKLVALAERPELSNGRPNTGGYQKSPGFRGLSITQPRGEAKKGRSRAERALPYNCHLPSNSEVCP